MTEGQCAAARPLDARRETIMVQIEGELDHCSAGRVRATLDAINRNLEKHLLTI